MRAATRDAGLHTGGGCESQVNHDNPSDAKHQVLKLDVPMDIAFTMEAAEGKPDLNQRHDNGSAP